MRKKKVLFHQDNALCHKSIRTMAKLHELHFQLLLYSDLAPSDYGLFANLRRMLQGKMFDSNGEVISETKAYFEAKDKFYSIILVVRTNSDDTICKFSFFSSIYIYIYIYIYMCVCVCVCVLWNNEYTNSDTWNKIFHKCFNFYRLAFIPHYQLMFIVPWSLYSYLRIFLGIYINIKKNTDLYDLNFVEIEEWIEISRWTNGTWILHNVSNVTWRILKKRTLIHWSNSQCFLL